MGAVPFSLAQGEVKTIANPARIVAVGGDNATEFYLKFPQFPPGSQWVFPFTYGFMYVLDAPSYQPVNVDASQVPPGSAAAPVTSKIAQLAAYDTDQIYNAGVSATGGTLTRWNINSAPGAGVKASATRAAAPGVTHVADFADIQYINNASATAAQRRFSIIDGPSGGAVNLYTTFLSVTAVAGSVNGKNLGPGLDLRGTPGNAITIEAAALDAAIIETVNLSGFDQ